MKYLRKILAISIITTIVLASTITSAANIAINNTTATTPSNVGIQTTVLTITDTITGTGFSDTNEITSATITTLSGTGISTTLAPIGADGNDAISTLTISTADLTDNTSYIVSFTTATGDFGTTTLRIGTPTNDTLTVTASVQPVLKFAMQSNSEAFGILSTSYATVTTGLEVGTNAVN